MQYHGGKLRQPGRIPAAFTIGTAAASPLCGPGYQRRLVRRQCLHLQKQPFRLGEYIGGQFQPYLRHPGFSSSVGKFSRKRQPDPDHSTDHQSWQRIKIPCSGQTHCSHIHRSRCQCRHHFGIAGQKPHQISQGNHSGHRYRRYPGNIQSKTCHGRHRKCSCPGNKAGSNKTQSQIWNWHDLRQRQHQNPCSQPVQYGISALQNFCKEHRYCGTQCHPEQIDHQRRTVVKEDLEQHPRGSCQESCHQGKEQRCPSGQAILPHQHPGRQPHQHPKYTHIATISPKRPVAQHPTGSGKNRRPAGAGHCQSHSQGEAVACDACGTEAEACQCIQHRLGDTADSVVRSPTPQLPLGSPGIGL